MHLVFHKVSQVIFIVLFSTFPIFKYKSITVNDMKHDYNITVKSLKRIQGTRQSRPHQKCDNWNVQKQTTSTNMYSSVNKCPSFALRKATLVDAAREATYHQYIHRYTLCQMTD